MLTLSSLLPILRQWNDYRKLLALPASGGDGDGPARLPLIDAAKPLVLAGLQHDLRRPLVVVTGDGHRAIQLFEQLKTWSALSDGVLLYPENEALPYESSVVDLQGSQERINALDRLVGGEGNDGLVVIVPARALMRKTIGPRTLRNLSRKLKVGDGLVPDGFLKYLLEAGYRPALVVDESGCFSRRGGIVDVFPPSNPVPVRIELFGDEIDTIREYDPSTQRTIRTVERVLLPPAEETAGVDLGRICEVLSGIDTSNLRPEVMAAWRFDLERLQSGQRFDRAAFYCAPFLESNLMDYLPSNSVLVLDEPLQVESIVNDLSAQAEGLRAELVQMGELPADFPRPYLDWSEIGPTLRAALRVDFPFGPAAEDHLSESHDGAAFSPQMMYGGKLKTLLEKSRQMARQGAVVIVSQQARRIGELFQELGVGASVIDSLESLPTAGSINLLQGAIQEGFSFQPGPEGDVFFVLSDAEVFGWAKQRRIVRRKVVPREVFLSDIEPGQFVVHVEHGIGRFLGMEHLAPDGVEREYLVIEYAENDKLYVPVDQLDRVSKYVGAGDQIPNVSRLGATDWLRTRERVRTATRQVARELLAVYAAREVSFGHAFQPDAPWQKELEDSFPYVETPDQIRAIEETKSDMEKPKPMDRLICGDVGYGKTEVALRAAFKAVMDGKQVAILVPTTVLAQQHFTTFTERMQAFPVRVEMLSRFRSDKEQKAVIEALKDGSVDICIGTHRLIQKDVSFKDLGLVIIDEEQRFGVMHKERLKRLRTEVDVLTLTATPIPRTLYMAIAGVRDMSTMETPPEERLPIRTFVAENNDHLVREAILREMDRGGQAYFVHNRVQSISLITRRLAELVPEAIISVGHGQMPDEQLEKVMFDFAAGKSDVLVCSTIIESGLDIPNVNTLIVNHADRFGLAQLYQLRGRVGRGANRAYAYFLYSKDKRLTPISEKRLRTISEATELGSGFRIAMKDLEIRGAGNLLGAEQHGHVSAVGFDLYCRLLADAVSLLKGEPVRHVSDVTMDVPLVALIPQTYVPDDPVRLSLYQRLANAESREQVGNIVLEMTDRFGPPPEPALNLAFLVDLKVLASHAGVKKISTDGPEIVLALPEDKFGLREDLRRDFGHPVTVGNALIRIVHQNQSGKWQSILQQLLERLCA